MRSGNSLSFPRATEDLPVQPTFFSASIPCRLDSSRGPGLVPGLKRESRRLPLETRPLPTISQRRPALRPADSVRPAPSGPPREGDLDSRRLRWPPLRAGVLERLREEVLRWGRPAGPLSCWLLSSLALRRSQRRRRTTYGVLNLGLQAPSAVRCLPPHRPEMV